MSLHLRTRTAKSAKAKWALTLLGVLGVFAASAIVFAATRGDFKLSVSSSNQTVASGRSASFVVKVKRLKGLKGSVTLGVKKLPAGARASWTGGSKIRSKANVIKKNVKSATLTIITGSATPAGTFKPTLTAKAGRVHHTKQLRLTVLPPTPGPGGGSSGGGGTVGGGTPTTPSAPAETTFGLNATPASRTLLNGDNTTVDVGLDRAGGYAGDVSFQVTGAPAGVSTTFAPATTSGNSSTLQIDTASSTVPGTYALVVTGTGGGKTSSTSVSLVVQQTQQFAIAGSASGTLSPGASAGLPLTLDNPYNFDLHITNVTVALGDTGVAGCVAADNYDVAQFSGTYPLTLPPGSHTLASISSAAQLPSVHMQDLSTNQDACKGVTVPLTYSGAATK